MQQNQPPRRPYDQNRDVQRSAASRPGEMPRNSQSEYGYNGEPLSRPRQQPAAQRRRQGDNSVQFPTQPRRQSAQRTQQKGNPSARRPQQNQRLRPTGQQPVRRDPARREKRKKRRLTRAAMRRRRFLRRLTAFLLLLAVIVVGGYLTVTMLFRIRSVQVQTADGVQVSEISGYSSERILQVLGVELEENIFSFEPGERAAVLEAQFPLLESIKVVREYPGTVVVQVTQAVPAYTMQVPVGWLTLSEKFKILSCEAQQPEGLIVLYGGDAVTTQPGDQLILEQTGEGEEDADALELLNTLLQKLEEYALLDQVTRIEFADSEQIAFLYQDRISVLLGTLNELNYKLERAHYVLTNADGKGCAATDTGRLDFSHTSTDTANRKIYFAQGEPTLPSGYVIPTPQPEPTAPAEDAAEAAQTETEGA